MKSRSMTWMMLLLVGATLVLAACATQPPVTSDVGPGFFTGIFHGFVSPFMFIASFFSDARIYAFPNAGRLYDFGYLIGVASFFGGTGAAAW